MKRSFLVVTLGLLFLLTTICVAENVVDNKAHYLAVDKALMAYNNGENLSSEQEALLADEGIIRDHADELDRFDGPDAFGYMYYDQDEEDGPVFDWLDISETGTEVAGMGDDGTQGPFDIPFPFPFYGENKTQIWFGYNGSVGFNNGIGTLSHSNIPNPGNPNDVIQFWQRDMHCGYGFTTVFYEAVTINDMDAFVVEYNHISQYGAARELENTVSCEIILFANGNIIVQYGYVGETLATATMTVGIENMNGTDGLEYCYNNADTAPGFETAILYTLGEENASVEGIVYDACTDEGIEGAMVAFDGYITTTDVDGFYTIPAMFAGDYDVTVEAEGYELFNQPGVMVEEGENAFDIPLNPFPEIAVDPDAFTFEVPWNGQDSDVMTISNVSACAADLSFRTSITYLDEEGLALRAVRDRVRENVARLRATPGTTIYNGPASTDLDAFEIAPTGVRLSELDDPYYLLIQDRGAWGGEENQAIMNELEIPFDIIGEPQMTEWELDEYTVLVVTSCQSQQFYNTFEANHDRFEDWVRSGGWIDFHGCVQSPQTWNFWDGMRSEYGTSPQNMVLEPDHPIVQGVNEVITGGSASHNFVVDLSDDALVIMENANAQPVVVEVPYGRGNVIVNTQTWEFYYNRANPDNCGSVMVNTFGYTMENAEGAGSWLTVEPDRGLIEADHSMDLDVMVDAAAAELLPGVYEAEINIESNAVNGEGTTVFVTLINGNPGFADGYVYDAETDLPLPAAEVTAWLDGEYYRSVFTDETGYYIMTLEEGIWPLSANAEHYDPSDIEQVTVVVNETTPQDFYLNHEIPGEFEITSDGIDVIELGLDFEAPWLGSDTKTVTVTNIGGLPLDFAWDIEYVLDEELNGVQRENNIQIERRTFSIPESFDLPSAEDLIEAPSAKRAYYKNVENAWNDLKKNTPLTLEKRQILANEGVLPPLHDELDREGGPDEFDYQFIDSDEANGPRFEWLNISETGTEVMGMGDDGTQGPVEIPFPFPFYGEDKTQIWFGYNGSVGFNNGIGTLSHAAVPSPNNPNDVIQFWQRDMHCGYGFTTVYYETITLNGLDCFVVEYNHLSQYGAAREESNTVSCEILMFEDGTIILQYGFIGETISRNTMTIGIENAAGTIGLEYCYNDDARCPAPETAIAFAVGGYNGGWLVGDPRGGYIEVEESTDFEFTADAFPMELDPGVYEAILTFSAEEPYEVTGTVFTSFIVGAPGIISGTVTDVETDEPLANAEVIVWQNGMPFRSVFTDEMGEYTLFIAEGTWEVSAHLEWYYPSDLAEVITITGETMIQNFELQHEIPPTLDADQEQMIFVAAQYGQDVEQLILTNNGGMPANFNIGVEYLDDEEIAARVIAGDNPFEPAENVDEIDEVRETVLPSAEDLVNAPEEKIQYYNDYRNALEAKESGKTLTAEMRKLISGQVTDVNELDNMGGPDEFGYNFIDSDEPDGPEYEWIDISETGTEIMGWSDDITHGPFDMDIDFPFYGETYNQFWLCSNGWLSFLPNQGQAYWWNAPLPLADTPNGVIYWHWCDLFPSGNDRAWYGTAPNGDFVVQIDFVPGAQVEVELIFRTNGAVFIQYGPRHTHPGGRNGTRVAVENQEGNVALVAADQPNPEFPQANKAIVFYTDTWADGWLATDPYEGTIEPTDDLVIECTADGALDSLDQARYYALMEIGCDYPDVDITNVWAEFIVGAAIFNPVPATGIPYPIIVDAASFNGVPVPDAAAIAVFDGDLCVGAFTADGEWPRSMIAWQGDPDQEIPGFTPGNDMTFMIWTEEAGEPLFARATYIEGDGTFGALPYTHLSNLVAVQVPTLDINLQRNYFELISTCVIPEDLDASSDYVFGDVLDLAIAYQDNGDIYLPPIVNTIGDITMTEGYRLFCFEHSNVVFEGVLMDEAAPYDLASNRWNWMGYPYYYDVPVDVALAEIADQIQIIQTDDGRLWIPAVNVNTIGNMTPGEGYMVYVSENVDFVYNNAAELAFGTTSEVWETPEVEGAPQATGLPYSVLVSFTDEVLALEPASIEVFDGHNLVGKAAVIENRDFTPVVTWEGNEEYNLAGFNQGSKMNFVVRDAQGNKLPLVIAGNTPAFGEGAYSSVTLEEAPMPTEFAVEQGYPNPFNPSVTIPFALPTAGEVSFAVYNVLGQQVLQSSRTFEAGYHRFIFDANNSGAELVSGMYFLQVNYAGSVKTQKLMLLK